MAEQNYSNLPDRPYDFYLSRGGEIVPEFDPNGNVETQPVKTNGSMGNVWIDNFIASTNWKPKTVGFYLNGETGYAEFQNVFITGEVNASVGNIGGFVIGPDYIRDTANSFGLASTVTGGNDVRFWAGTSFENRNLTYPDPLAPPFVVYENGTGHMGGFNINLDNFISDLGNVELNQANDTISVGILPSSTRVVMDGTSGSFQVWNTANEEVGRIIGGSTTAHDGLRITSVNPGANQGDITIWPGNTADGAAIPVPSFGFSSDGFGDVAMLYNEPTGTTASTFFPATPISPGSGVTSDLGSNASTDTIWRNIYTKNLGDSVIPVDQITALFIGSNSTPVISVITNQLGSGATPVGSSFLNLVEAVQITGPGLTKATILANVTACPLPTFTDALDVIRRIPDPVRIDDPRAHFGDRMYIDDLTFPDEALFTIMDKREIELTNMAGLLVQSVRQLTEKVDRLEQEANKKGFLTRLYRSII